MRKSRRAIKVKDLTPRKLFLGIGVASWIIGLIGCSQLGASFLIGLALITVTMFHGLVIVAVYFRKPLHRKIVESNVVTRPVR